MSSSPTRPAQGSPGKRSPTRTAGSSSPPKQPGVVGPREWEKSLTVKCRLCGGSKCRRCSESAAILKTNSPVTGLHADWVTDSMLGMMRPSTRLIQTYRLVEQFHKLGIKAIFNLTIPGEHPHCGDGLVASGFPYDPETDWMAHNKFYNFGWEDMTTPTIGFMVDLVRVMTGVLGHANQKLAVHCHAGFGRTGLAIACALVFQHDISPTNVIDIVRRGRPGSIQTTGQVDFVRAFYEHVHGAKLVFAMPTIHDRFTLERMVAREQSQYMNPPSSGSHGVIPPKVVSLHGTWLGFIRTQASSPTQARQLSMIYITHLPASFDHSVSTHYEHMKLLLGDTNDVPLGQAMVVAADDLWPHKVKMNMGDFTEPPPECLSGLLLDWLEHLDKPLIQDAKVLSDTNAFDALPLLTLRTIECVFHLIKAFLAHVDDPAIVHGLIGRTAMACLQLSAVSAKSFFPRIRQLVDSWTCPRPLALNLDLIAHLNQPTSQDDDIQIDSSSTLLPQLPRPASSPSPRNPSACAESPASTIPETQSTPELEHSSNLASVEPKEALSTPAPRPRSPPRTLPALPSPRKPKTLPD
ncbi:hypothetical protein LEN26_014092 [Aphanomyces euteiches]|nr:hypothetical protein LEN26_014092 [Aphanomyces euteiches]